MRNNLLEESSGKIRDDPTTFISNVFLEPLYLKVVCFISETPFPKSYLLLACANG